MPSVRGDSLPPPQEYAFGQPSLSRCASVMDAMQHAPCIIFVRGLDDFVAVEQQRHAAMAGVAGSSDARPPAELLGDDIRRYVRDVNAGVRAAHATATQAHKRSSRRDGDVLSRNTIRTHVREGALSAAASATNGDGPGASNSTISSTVVQGRNGQPTPAASGASPSVVRPTVITGNSIHREHGHSSNPSTESPEEFATASDRKRLVTLSVEDPDSWRGLTSGRDLLSLDNRMVVVVACSSRADSLPPAVRAAFGSEVSLPSGPLYSAGPATMSAPHGSNHTQQAQPQLSVDLIDSQTFLRNVVTSRGAGNGHEIEGNGGRGGGEGGGKGREGAGSITSFSSGEAGCSHGYAGSEVASFRRLHDRTEFEVQKPFSADERVVDEVAKFMASVGGPRTRRARAAASTVARECLFR